MHECVCISCLFLHFSAKSGTKSGFSRMLGKCSVIELGPKLRKYFLLDSLHNSPTHSYTSLYILP